VQLHALATEYSAKHPHHAWSASSSLSSPPEPTLRALDLGSAQPSPGW